VNRIVVTGTGTSIGKTHFAAALARACLNRKKKVAAFKPIESGVEPNGGQPTDAAALAAVSAFHVKRWLAPVYTLREPLSPHLAARRAGITIDLRPVIDAVRLFDSHELDALILELAGGLFTPLNAQQSNADLITSIRNDADAGEARHDLRVVIVAPDRLGVLHDLTATTRAAAAMNLALAGIVLVTPQEPDASTGINGGELPHITPIPLLGTLRRAPVDALAADPQLTQIATALQLLDHAPALQTQTRVP
jgi:dethiobiotin synthetase